MKIVKYKNVIKEELNTWDLSRSPSLVDEVKHVSGDCGSKETLEVKITRGKRYTSRYILEGDKLTQMVDDAKWDGKVVKLRDPLYCKAPAGTFCNICVGDKSFISEPKTVLTEF